MSSSTKRRQRGRGMVLETNCIASSFFNVQLIIAPVDYSSNSSVHNLIPRLFSVLAATAMGDLNTNLGTLFISIFRLSYGQILWMEQKSLQMVILITKNNCCNQNCCCNQPQLVEIDKYLHQEIAFFATDNIRILVKLKSKTGA